MTDSPRRLCRAPSPALNDDAVALLRPMFARMLIAFSRWGLEDDVPTPPVPDSEINAFIKWMWARPQDRASMLAALAELRNDHRAG